MRFLHWSAIASACVGMVPGHLNTAHYSSSGDADVRVSQDSAGTYLEAHHATLEEVAAALSKSLRINVILDVPARTDRADVSASGSVDDVLKAVAAKFDLVCQRKGQIVLGRQGFARSGSRLQLLPAEMAAVAGDVMKVVNHVAPGCASTDPSKPFNDFALSLTAAQLAQLRGSGKLKVAELNDRQVDLLRTTMYSMSIGYKARDWEELAYELTHLNQSYFQLRDVPGFYYRRNGQTPPGGDKPALWRWSWVLQYAQFREYEFPVQVPGPGVVATQQDISPRMSDDTGAPPKDPGRSSDGVRGAEAPQGLATTVNLSIGETTVGALARSLGEQSGLNVVPAPTVADRQLLVLAPRVTAQAALDALAELDGWEWDQRPSGKITLGRRRVLLPRSPQQVPLSLQRCLTPEIAQLLGDGAPVDRLSTVTDTERKKRLERSTHDPDAAWYSNVDLGREMLLDMTKTDTAILKRSCRPEFVAGTRLLWKDVDAKTRQSLVNLLALKAITSLAQNDANFFTGHLKPYQADITCAQVSVSRDGGLQVMAEAVVNGAKIGSGFSVGLDRHVMDALSSPPPPR